MKKVLPINLKSNSAKSTKYHWSLNLIRELENPESIIEEDQFIYVIKDKFPKSTHHYLILPKKDIPSISKVTKDDLELLRYMDFIAEKYIDRHRKYDFQTGYHAVPSMYRLHLHVISKDFMSNALKTARHWNIFNTPYFLPSKDVIKELEEKGHVPIDVKRNEEYLKSKLKCHRCSFTTNNISDLKKHITAHFDIE